MQGEFGNGSPGWPRRPPSVITCPRCGEQNADKEMIKRSMDIEGELGRRVAATNAAGHFLGPLEHRAGNYEEAERVLRDAYTQMSETGDRAFSSTVAGYLAPLYVDLGRFDDAERYGRITLDTAQSDDVEAQTQGNSAMARVLAGRGEFETAEATARRAVAIAEGTDYLTRRGSALLNLGEVLLAAGRPVEAADAVRRSIENFDAKGATALAADARRRLAEIDAT